MWCTGQSPSSARSSSATRRSACSYLWVVKARARARVIRARARARASCSYLWVANKVGQPWPAGFYQRKIVPRAAPERRPASANQPAGARAGTQATSGCGVDMGPVLGPRHLKRAAGAHRVASVHGELATAAREGAQLAQHHLQHGAGPAPPAAPRASHRPATHLAPRDCQPSGGRRRADLWASSSACRRRARNGRATRRRGASGYPPRTRTPLAVAAGRSA
eukprot:scaffold104827_cov63-Phaeocystis_antarctica.AAC.4